MSSAFRIIWSKCSYNSFYNIELRTMVGTFHGIRPNLSGKTFDQARLSYIFAMIFPLFITGNSLYWHCRRCHVKSFGSRKKRVLWESRKNCITRKNWERTILQRHCSILGATHWLKVWSGLVLYAQDLSKICRPSVWMEEREKTINGKDLC